MIEPATRPAKVRRLIAYDLEWWPQSYQLRCAGSYDGERYRCYRTIPDFLAGELTASTAGAWYYAHFGGGADMLFLLPVLFANPAYRVEVAFSGSSAVIVSLHRGRHTWTFLDSYFTLRVPEAKIGEWLGLPKLPVDFRTCTDAEIVAHNERDCEILWRALDRFQAHVLAWGGELERTISATALALFRRKYLKRSIQTSDVVNHAAEYAYTGGRTEIIRPRCRHAWDYDINSSFAYAMASRPVPGDALDVTDRLPTKPDVPYLASLTVSVPEDTFLPPLPYRHGGGIVFPTGTWRNWFTAPHVEALLETPGARIDQIHEVIPFRPCWDMQGYAEDLFAHRRAVGGKTFEGQCDKALLVSLYGKTGEACTKQQIAWQPERLPPCEYNPTDDPELCDHCFEEPCPRRMISPGLWAFTLTRQVNHRHVPIAATITADAQLRLWRLMREVEAKGSLYYVDTDSVYSSRTLKQSDALGGLKLEARVDHRYEALRPKLYRRDGEIKAKGFDRLTPKQFDALKRGRAVRQTRMLRVRELLQCGIKPCEKSFLKRLRREYVPKRKPLGSNSTRPWTVAELQARR